MNNFENEIDFYVLICYTIIGIYAGMAELADAPDLGSGVSDVQVQVLLPAPWRVFL